MEIPKEQIVSLIKERMGGDQAQQADQELPDQVDHEEHAGTLSKFGVDPQELLGGGGGAGGAIGDMLGGGGEGESSASAGESDDAGSQAGSAQDETGL